MSENPKVHVSSADTNPDGKPWRVDCDACPTEDGEPLLRFFSRHWAVAAADHHAKVCPNAPVADPGATS